MQKVEVQFSWWNLNPKGMKMWTVQNRTGLYIGNMKVGEFYLREDDQKWVVICNDKKLGEFTRPLISRQDAAIICLTAAKTLLKIED